MKKIILSLFLIFGALFTMTTETNAAAKSDLIYMDVPAGRVTIETFPMRAPKHVERIKTLTKEGFYDGIVFHRVIDGFMAQTGDPTGTGTGGSKLPDLPAEFNDYHFERGVIGMARSASPNSGNSQFFICFEDCGFLDGQYTVWGKVIEGMEHIDAIKKGEPPVNPDKIIKMTLGDAEASK
jgi:peptidylprolyl isomerase